MKVEIQRVAKQKSHDFWHNLIEKNPFHFKNQFFEWEKKRFDWKNTFYIRKIYWEKKVVRNSCMNDRNETRFDRSSMEMCLRFRWLKFNFTFMNFGQFFFSRCNLIEFAVGYSDSCHTSSNSSSRNKQTKNARATAPNIEMFSFAKCFDIFVGTIFAVAIWFGCVVVFSSFIKVLGTCWPRSWWNCDSFSSSHFICFG